MINSNLRHGIKINGVLHVFNSPATFKRLLPMKGTSKRIILLQTPWNIWPPALIAPFPIKRTQNKHPIVGCSCMVFLSDGSGIWQDCAWGPWGDLEFMVRARQLVRISHMLWYGSLQVQWGLGTRTWKYHCGKIRCPHVYSYQDRAFIYCKQRIIPWPSMNPHWREPATQGNRALTYSNEYIMLAKIMNLLSCNPLLRSCPRHSSADVSWAYVCVFSWRAVCRRLKTSLHSALPLCHPKTQVMSEWNVDESIGYLSAKQSIAW